ncbi:MAG: aminotransferase class I/II-fold pyridoxal phosphate-dependent enzyme [Parcubacteria group bacterium]
MKFFRPISISLSPNTEKDDIQLAFRLLFCPWKYKTDNSKQSAINNLENEFKNYLGVRHAISFNSGRSSLMAILNSLGLQRGDEILLQVFTCNAVPNPIIWSGFKPVYVDANEQTFNIDAEDLKRKIVFRQVQGGRARAVIVQHTFGLPSDMEEILKICQENNLILIEDCAHSLGAEYHGQKVGSFGKASFFSFSRDKVISSVYGGMVATDDDELAKRIKQYQEKIDYPSYLWVKQQLLHPILMDWIILPTYSILGKYLLVLFQWLHVLSKAVHWKEKRGKKPAYFPKKLPNALAILAQKQFKKLGRFNSHRQEIAEFYRRELKNTSFELPPETEQVYLRFMVKHPKAHEIIRRAWDKNLLMGDWYNKVIAPHDTKLEKMGYVLGSCPKAEKLSKITLNLPTHINISIKEAEEIIKFIKKY